MSSRNRDYGTPNDMFITFPDQLVNASEDGGKTSIELAEFAINRMWYDVQAGVNDTFNVYKADTMNTFTITIPPGWYTVNQDNVAAGTRMELELTALLFAVIPSIAWNVQVSNQLGVLIFTTPGVAAANSYNFDFTSPTSRCNELLGFNKAVYSSTKLAGATYETIVAPRPFNLNRTPQLLMHTDIPAAYPQCTIDNYGLQSTTSTGLVVIPRFGNSDIMAAIPVDQPPRGLINYQAKHKINRIWIKPTELRTIRIFITDDREVLVDLTMSEWTAVFRVVYGDNLSI